MSVYKFGTYNWEMAESKKDIEIFSIKSEGLYNAIISLLKDEILLLYEDIFKKCDIDEDDEDAIIVEKIKAYYPKNSDLINAINDLEIGSSCIHLEYIKKDNRYIYRNPTNDFDD